MFPEKPLEKKIKKSRKKIKKILYFFLWVVEYIYRIRRLTMQIKIKNKKYTITTSNKAQENLSKELESKGFKPYTYIIKGIRNALYLAYQTKNGDFIIIA